MLGFLAFTIAAAAARPGPAPALTITPGAHDFGRLILRVGSDPFQFRISLPPGGAPADSVTVSFTGPNAGDFRVNPYVVRPVAGTAMTSTCQDATWRSGSCDIWVQFTPQAEGVRSATLVVTDTRGNRGTASLTGTGIFGCRPSAGVPCNYADNYSGTFDWSSMLITSSGDPSGPAYKGRAVLSVRVSVVKGIAYCTGSQSDSTASLTAGRLDEMKKMYGDIAGPGIFSIEFVKEDGQLVYKIKAWCPTAKGTITATVYQPRSPPQTTTGTFDAKPAKVGGSGGMTSDSEPTREIGHDLSGSKTIEHPDADALNGVTGTLTRSWSLIRS